MWRHWPPAGPSSTGLFKYRVDCASHNLSLIIEQIILLIDFPVSDLNAFAIAYSRQDSIRLRVSWAIRGSRAILLGREEKRQGQGQVADPKIGQGQGKVLCHEQDPEENRSDDLADFLKGGKNTQGFSNAEVPGFPEGQGIGPGSVKTHGKA